MNWKNSFHDILMLSFGQSFLIDEAYRILHEMAEDRMFSIASAYAESKRAQAKIISAKHSIAQGPNLTPKSMRRRSEAFILETKARTLIAQPCLDMAKAELTFIQRMIQYVDDNKLRLHDNLVVANQVIQPMESAFELVWSLAVDPSGSAFRNATVHPYSKAIFSVADGLNNDDRSTLAHQIARRLAQEFDIDAKHLSITVNTMQIHMVEQASKELLADYRDSHVSAMLKLTEVSGDVRRIEEGRNSLESGA